MGDVGNSAKSLGKQIQSARKAAGLTQQELCQQTDISYSTLAKIERGAIAAPSVFTVMKIADAVSLSVDQLCRGTNLPLKRSGIEFVYFDVNGCLVQFFHRAFSELAQVSNVASDVIETTFWHYNDAVCRGEMSLEQFNTMLAEELGVESINWLDCYMRAVEPIAEMQALVKEVAKDYRVGLLTNIMPGTVEALLKQGYLPDIEYAAIIDSSEVGAIKPEPKMYEIAQGLTGVAPDKILFIDDSRTNLMAAEELGWRVLWFDDFRLDDSVARIRSSL